MCSVDRLIIMLTEGTWAKGHLNANHTPGQVHCSKLCPHLYTCSDEDVETIYAMLYLKMVHRMELQSAPLFGQTAAAGTPDHCDLTNLPPPTPSHHMWWSQIEVNYKASQICCHPFEHPLNTGYYTTYEACLAKEDIAALERSITESCVSVARCIWWIYGFNALRMIRAKFTKVYQVSVVQHYLYAIVSA